MRYACTSERSRDTRLKRESGSHVARVIASDSRSRPPPGAVFHLPVPLLQSRRAATFPLSSNESVYFDGSVTRVSPEAADWICTSCQAVLERSVPDGSPVPACCAEQADTAAQSHNRKIRCLRISLSLLSLERIRARAA